MLLLLVEVVVVVVVVVAEYAHPAANDLYDRFHQ